MISRNGRSWCSRSISKRRGLVSYCWNAGSRRSTGARPSCKAVIERRAASSTSTRSLHCIPPTSLVLQDTSKTGTRRAPRIRALNRQTLQLAKRRGVPVRTYSRAAGARLFRGPRSHDEAPYGRDHRTAYSRARPVSPASAQTVEDRRPTNGYFRSCRFSMEVSAIDRPRYAVLSQNAARENDSCPTRSVI